MDWTRCSLQYVAYVHLHLWYDYFAFFPFLCLVHYFCSVGIAAFPTESTVFLCEASAVISPVYEHYDWPFFSHRPRLTCGCRCACVCVSVWDSTFCTHAINMISSRIFFRLRPHRSSARISMDRMVCGPKTGGMCVCAVCALFYMFSFFMIRTWRLQVVVNG